ncbi:MAG: hypothetical protein ACUVXB_08995 [Bryobacteraceae bacterium]
MKEDGDPESRTAMVTDPGGYGDAEPALSEHIGKIAHRLALVGGWIDQPFVSRVNPDPPGSMVVVSLEPEVWFMDRAGMAGSTRRIALQLWKNGLPPRPAAELVRELYWAENKDKADPSGSQDMIGLIYPGISRLDYDARFEGGVFPVHIESCCNPEVAEWLERVLHLIAVNQRPPGYSPLGVRNLDPVWVRRLGQTGKECYQAILARDLGRLGESMNECMVCWERILPHTLRQPSIPIDLMGLLGWFQKRYAGAVYSGCGGGYLIVASDKPVPGSFQVKVRRKW